MKRWIPILVLFGLLVAAVAEARPGGGHSSSGGGRSSSGGGGGGRSSSSGRSYGGGGGGGAMSGEAVVLMLVVVVVIMVVKAVQKAKAGPEWTSETPELQAPVRAIDFSAQDPAFSRAVFEDFAFELYAAAHRARNTAEINRLQPYLSDGVIGALAVRGEPPQQVVVGTLRIESNPVQAGYERMMVRIEATHLGRGTPVFVVEHWMFGRAQGVQSKPPDRTRTWPCPNCGAPWVASPTRACAHCGTEVSIGKFDWCVEQIWVDSEHRALASLTGTVPEYGNDLPTVIDPMAHVLMGQITGSDSNVSFETLRPRIELVYAQLNASWNASDLTAVRGFVTAALRNYLEYWLREYARQDLRNTLADARIHDIQLAKVTRDTYYDAITVRVFADGCDFTANAAGKIVGGSQTTRRAYTEYWTFLRSSTRLGPVTTSTTCPNCGAPLQISDIGDCTHCNAAVENGSFDWTLSKIEQDDSYSG